MLGKPWLVSELTGTNNSHSICGFLSYEECACKGLEAAARAGEEARDCLMCLACREPQSTQDLKVCPSLGKLLFTVCSPTPELGLTGPQILYKCRTQFCV